MPEDIAKDRKVRIEKNNDSSTLITEETEGGNIYKKPIFDVMEYIEMSAGTGKDSDIAQKILKLKQYGITDEQIVTEYKKYASTMENENTISANLDLVFIGLATYINDLPNGIVIDLVTAMKNEDKSFEQAIEYGIYPEDSVVENFNDSVLKEFGKYLGKENEDNNDISAEVLNWLSNFNFDIGIDNNEDKILNQELDEFLKKDENDMKISNPLKNISRESKKTIVNSPYETDMFLFEITKLQLLLKQSKNKETNDLLLQKISDFYKKHPTYVSVKIPILNQDGSLNRDELAKMEAYSNAYQKMIILEHIDELNGMTPEELQNIDPVEKRHMTMCAFAGLKFSGSKNKDENALAEECFGMIKSLYPGLDLTDKAKLARIFNENTELNANFKSLSLEELTRIYSCQLKESTEDYIEKDQESYIGNKEINFSTLDLDSNMRKIHESSMQNYFLGSNIELDSNEEDMYKIMYQNYTIDSWIQSKDDAIRLRYMALMHMREEYKTLTPNDYINNKKEKLEEDIKAFEKKFGKLNITEEEYELFEGYKENFINAGLTKYLTRDVLEWEDGKNYNDLNVEHKKGYIRNILVALEDKDTPNKAVHKLALRRLELMGKFNGESFVTFENGEPIVNKELILKEYNRMSKNYHYESYEELAYSAELRKNEYLLTKLEEYTNLDKKAFLKLDDNCDREVAMTQIEERRKESNQKRIEERARFILKWRSWMSSAKETAKNKEILEKISEKCEGIITDSIYSSDPGLLEASKLYIELENSVGKPKYSKILDKLDEFNRENPEYLDKKLPVLNEDGSLNKKELGRIKEYEDAYQKKIILKELKTFGNLNEKDLKNLSQDEKRKMTMCAFAGLQYADSNKNHENVLAIECMKMIKKLYPSFDLNNETKLAEIFNETSLNKIKVESLSFKDLIKIYSRHLEKTVESYIRADFELDKQKGKIPEGAMDGLFENGVEVNTSGINARTDTTRDETSKDQQSIENNSANISETTSSKRDLTVSEIVVDKNKRKNKEKISIFKRMKSAFDGAKVFISRIFKGKATEALGPGEGTDEGVSNTSTVSGKKDNNAKANGNFVPTSATPVPTFVGDEGKNNQTQNPRGTSAEDKDVGLDL